MCACVYCIRHLKFIQINLKHLQFVSEISLYCFFFLLLKIKRWKLTLLSSGYGWIFPSEAYKVIVQWGMCSVHCIYSSNKRKKNHFLIETDILIRLHTLHRECSVWYWQIESKNSMQSNHICVAMCNKCGKIWLTNTKKE